MIQNYSIHYDVDETKFPKSLKRRGMDKTESFENFKDEVKRAFDMVYGIKKKNVWIKINSNKPERLFLYDESGTRIEGQLLKHIQDIAEKIYEIGVFWSESTEEDDE